MPTFSDPQEKQMKQQERKDGFTLIPLRRGGTELAPLLELFDKVERDTGQKCYVCGGFARWCASPLQNPFLPTDLDIYFEDDKSFDAISKILYNITRLDRTSPVAMTYIRPNDKGNFLTYLPPIQLIKPNKKGNLVSRGTLQDIISHFDFTVIRVGIQDNKWALADMDFVQDETNHILYIKRVQCPVSSFGRCLKYAKKQYYLPPHETIKMLQDWDSRTKKYKDKLIKLLEKMQQNKTLNKSERELMYELLRLD